MADLVPIQVFLSYARSDDEEFSFVDPLVNKLKAIVKAKSGRALNVFVDRNEIGWGETWRERLRESVLGATVFMPLLTATYLERPACREEFLTFHSNAEVLGVTELLLPIMVFDSPLFGPESPDEIAQIAESLQYKSIEDALLAGFNSPEWLTRMSELAGSLITALMRAEASLASQAFATGGEPSTSEVSQDQSSNGQGLESTQDDANLGGAGIAEYMVAIEESITEMTSAANEFTPALDQFNSATGSVGSFPDNPKPKDVQLWAMRLATAVKEPAAELETCGRQLYSATKGLDESIIGIRQVASGIEDEALRASLEGGLNGLLGKLGDLDEVEISMNETIAVMKPAELISVPLRKALAPARRGLTAVRDTVQMISSWRSSDDEA
ncbi:toll/interleukin-1 receptor domain-containing protein [Myceligenerans cantabricum]